jgi:DNA-binding LacI/PurR family transcriptional regulator
MLSGMHPMPMGACAPAAHYWAWQTDRPPFFSLIGLAMGAYHAAYERGLSVPGDLSVIVFDNQTNVSEGLFPRLTSVALPHYEMGDWAVRTLIHRSERPSSVPVQVALNCPLVRRDSVGPPREVPR